MRHEKGCDYDMLKYWSFGVNVYYFFSLITQLIIWMIVFPSQVKAFHLPHCHAQHVFGLLVTHLRAHYYNGYNSNIASIIRNIVSMLLFVTS